MSILLLVVVLLVIAIVLSRLTWASQLGERRSIKHHEQAMDVLRSVAGRPEDVEEPAYSGQGAPQGGSHVRSSIDDAAGFPAPAGGTAGRAVPEPTVHREETIRILGAEPSGAEPPKAEPPKAEPPKAEPPRVAPSEPRPEELVRSEAAGGPAGVEARQAGVGSPPSWEPAHGPSDAPQSMPDGDGKAAEPAIVFLDDDSGRPGPVTVPPQVADAMRHDRGDRRGNGDGWGDGRRGSDGGWPDSPGTPGGSGWGNGHRWGDEPTAVSSTLPSPPTIGDQDWASSRSEARSRSRARTRSRLLGRVLAPFVATGRAASGARDRLGARGAGAGVDTAEGGADAWSAGSVAETTAD